MKQTLIFLLWLSSVNLFGQDIQWSEWQTIYKDTTEIKLILDRFKTADSLNAISELTNQELVTFNEENPAKVNGLKDLEPFEYLTSKEEDGVYVYCLIDIKTNTEYRASYIYLDGTKLKKTEIDSLRPIIIQKFENGISFEDLNEEYNMDPNPNKGDLGWFKKGAMVLEFEKAIREHKLDEIFTVDIPERNWYYVALKTFDNRQNKERTYLKIKSSN